MNISETKEQKWKISKQYKVIYSDVITLSIEEQECIFTIDRFDKIINVDCTYPAYINKLRRSELFTVESFLVSKKSTPKGYLLGVMGVLNIKGISIRKRIVKMSKNHKQALLKGLKESKGKKK